MVKKITQAIILCAGLGTRLRPLTNNIPKVMIPILGKPLLEHHIEQFKRHGVNEFFFNLHYLPDVIQNYFGDGSNFGVRIHYAFESAIRGTAGGMKHFEENIKDLFFLIYGDIFSFVDYTKMLKSFYLKSGAIGMQRVGLTGYRPDVDFVKLDSRMRFLEIYSKPHTIKLNDPYSMRGLFILQKRIFDYIPEGKKYELSSQLLPDVIKRGEKFYGYECSDYSKGIDTLEKYQEVEAFLKSGSVANDKK